jgi:ribosomal-protein-alanine N-acetyltransferase
VTERRAASRDLETARLQLRPYRLDDLEAMAALYDDHEVTLYTKLGRQNRARVAAILQNYLAEWRERDFGMCAVFLKASRTYVGECGVFTLPSGEVALRYAFTKAAWGRGYAVEATMAILEDAFLRARLPQLLSIVQLRNTGSRRVMEKLGWPLWRKDKDGDVEIAIYRETREDWLLKRG